MKKIRVVALITVFALATLTVGCGVSRISTKKEKDIDYTVMADNEIPEEVMSVIEEKKSMPFKVAYSDPENTYILIGYGKQDYKGYTINIEDIYETSNAIYVKTQFKGPDEYTNTQSETYPYIVIKIEYTDKNIVFGE